MELALAYGMDPRAVLALADAEPELAATMLDVLPRAEETA